MISILSGCNFCGVRDAWKVIIQGCRTSVAKENWPWRLELFENFVEHRQVNLLHFTAVPTAFNTELKFSGFHGSLWRICSLCVRQREAKRGIRWSPRRKATEGKRRRGIRRTRQYSRVVRRSSGCLPSLVLEIVEVTVEDLPCTCFSQRNDLWEGKCSSKRWSRRECETHLAEANFTRSSGERKDSSFTLFFVHPPWPSVLYDYLERR